MALVVDDRIQETTTTTGTSTYTLNGAKTGFQSFAAVGDGNTTYYCCTDGTDFEVGLGTFTSSGTTLARTTIVESSNSNNAVDWSAGTKDIFVTLPASKAVFEDANNNVTINSLVTSSNGNIELDPDGSGKVVFKGNSTKGSGQLVLNCEQNSHGVTIKGPPHSSNADYTLTLPSDDGVSGQSIISDGSGNLSFSTITGNVTHTGEVTGANSLTIADNVVDEANLKVSNSPVDGYVLVARSGNTGGLTWEEASSAGNVDLSEQEFTASAGQTVFTVSSGITDADNVTVFLNGSKLASSDVTINSSANTFTLSAGATAGDLITVNEYSGTASSGSSSAFTDLSDTPSSLGSAGQVVQVNSSGNALEFANSTGTGVTVHSNQAAMLTDAASATEGSLHYDTGLNKLYVKQSSGFFLLATITNTAPTIDSFSENTGGAGSNDLANGSDNIFTLTSGSNTVITIDATDPDLESVVYSATVTSGTASDVISSPSLPISNQSSNTFTLVPVTSGSGGTITIRFDVSDGSNIANVEHSFSISFAILNSNHTRLLISTDSSGDNNDIVDTPASGGSSKSVDVTDATNVIAGAFSPYAAEYSVTFDGSSDYLSVPIPAFGSSDFSVSMWLYPTGYGSSNYTAIIDTRSGSDADTNGFAIFLDPNLKPYLVYNNNDYSTAGDPTLTMNEWNYLLLNYSSGSFTISVNGTSGSSDAISVNLTRTSAIIGRKYSSNQHMFIGSITDLVIKTTTSTVTAPTERVSATGTQLLTCHLPYFGDGSSNDHTITVFGTPKIQRFSPYDFGEYDKTSRGGSILFKNYSGTSYTGNGNGTSAHLLIDKSSSSENSASTDLYLDANNWTVKGWLYVNVPMGSLQNLGIMHNYAASTNNSAVRYTGFGFSLRATSGSSGSYGSHVLRWTHGRGGSSNNENFSTTFAPFRWYYLEITNTNGTVSLKVNGKADSTTYSADARPTGTWPLRFGALGSGSYATQYEFEFPGFLSDWQIVNGSTAVESSVPTAPMSTHSNSKLHLKSVDAHVLDKVQVSNLQLFGTSASTSALSAISTPPRVGANWDGTSAVSFDGDSDYVIPSNLSDLPGDFTLETWMYVNSVAASGAPFDSRPLSTNGQYLTAFTRSADGKISLYIDSSHRIISDSTIPVQTWFHFAISRQNNTIKMYIDGTAQSTTYTNSNTMLMPDDRPLIGVRSYSLGDYFNGYMQDFRVTEGLARYTLSDETANIPIEPLKG